MVKNLRYWVIAGSSPRMAAQDAFDAEPAAFENTVFEDRFDHILAAGGGVAAGRWRQGRDEHTVKIDGD